jgi:hypothetical protein
MSTPSMMTPPFDGDCRRGRDAAEYLSKRITPPTSIAVTATTPMRLRIVNCARANRIDTTSCSAAMSDLQSIRSTFIYRFTPDCVRQLSIGYYTSGGRGGGGGSGSGNRHGLHAAREYFRRSSEWKPPMRPIQSANKLCRVAPLFSLNRSSIVASQIATLCAAAACSAAIRWYSPVLRYWGDQ